jgi:hypothetical protein
MFPCVKLPKISMILVLIDGVEGVEIIVKIGA